jgi:hypothetical protein
VAVTIDDAGIPYTAMSLRGTADVDHVTGIAADETLLRTRPRDDCWCVVEYADHVALTLAFDLARPRRCRRSRTRRADGPAARRHRS